MYWSALTSRGSSLTKLAPVVSVSGSGQYSVSARETGWMRLAGIWLFGNGVGAWMHVAGGVEDARRRVVDRDQVAAGVAQVGEVAGPPGGERHRRRPGQRLGLAQALPVEHEEQPVAAVQQVGDDDRAAQRRAVLVALERRDRPIVAIEVVLGVERRMARELEHRAMELVGARLGGGVDLRDGPAVLGVEQAGEDVELLQRVHRRQQHVGVEVQVGVLDPVERVVVEVDALAGDVEGEAVALPAHALLALAGRRPVRGRARDQRGELQVVASVERQLDDRAVLDDRADRGVLGLQERRAALDLDHLGELADFQRERDAAGAAHLHGDVLALQGAEPAEGGLERVDARLERRHHVEPRLVGLELADGVGALVGQRDRHAGHRRAARIGHDAADFTGRRLRRRDRGEADTHNPDRRQEPREHGAPSATRRVNAFTLKKDSGILPAVRCGVNRVECSRPRQKASGAGHYQSTTEPSSVSNCGLYSRGSPTWAISLFSSMVMPRPGSVRSGRWPFTIGGSGLARRSVYSLSPRS